MGETNVITRVLIRGSQSLKKDVVTETDKRVMEKFEDAMLLALKMEKGPQGKKGGPP